MSYKLRKELGLLEVICISTGAMISSGLFILPALAFARTGPSVILSYALASLLVIPTMFAKAELATALPRTGGVFIFTDRCMGPVAGMLTGLAAWFAFIFKAAFAFLGIALFVSFLEHNFSEGHRVILSSLCIVFFTIINLYGIKLTSHLQTIMVAFLVGILGVYSVWGLFFINFEFYTPFILNGAQGFVSTAGLVFISYAGTTKIAAIAGEIQNPQRNLPLGLIISWILGSLLYVLVIFVTIGIVPPEGLRASLLPLTSGGEALWGNIGVYLLSFAGMLAFITTGNAGILTASRDAMAMGEHRFLPASFTRVSKTGVPFVAILYSSGIMITILVALELEVFVKTASTLTLILFVLVNIAVIFFRQNRPKNYRPTFEAPLYPWIYIIGIIFYSFLIIDMGFMPIVLVISFLVLSLLWYYIYSYEPVKKDYALLKLIKKSAYVNAEDYYFNEELREFLNEEKPATEIFFKNSLKRCQVINFDRPMKPQECFKEIALAIARRTKVKNKHLLQDLIKQEKDSNIISRAGAAVILIFVPGKKIFDISIVRTFANDLFPENPNHPIHNAFILISSKPEEHLYFPALRWLYMIAERINYEEDWHKAKTDKELRSISLEAWRYSLTEE
jgi:amino acid transporter